jgi:hypothetical protein
MAHIQKIPTDYGTRYEVRWMVGHGPTARKQQRSFRIKKEAQQFKTLIEGDALRGEVADISAARRPFREFAESYLRSLEIKDRTRKGSARCSTSGSCRGSATPRSATSPRRTPGSSVIT